MNNHYKQQNIQNSKGDNIMNTYLVPVTKEFQSTYTDIMIIYANTEKEAYYNAKIENGLVSRKIRK